jgi:hypothetical protein
MKKYTLILLLFFIIGSGFAQTKIDTVRFYTANDSVRAVPNLLDLVTISNNTSAAVSIKLSIDKTNWQIITFKGVETKLLDLYKAPEAYAILTTAGTKESPAEKTAKYRLYKQKKYSFYWNTTDLKWDLKQE